MRDRRSELLELIGGAFGFAWFVWFVISAYCMAACVFCGTPYRASYGVSFAICVLIIVEAGAVYAALAIRRAMAPKRGGYWVVRPGGGL